ncbi:MAG: Cd(II)/Pb(II)-responsive transcriptional regulator [Proteobacteria bacterium]|nr:Cd(II)/Pb(II)-responsive transcriptional regulator [Pseudomonadota bacterium]
MKIGELARLAECPVETIRYYEHEGLLPRPLRSGGNYRLYSREHLERLSFIRNCRALDMMLDEIRQLLRLCDAPRDNCAAAHGLLDEHIAHVAERIGELRQLERRLQALRRQCGPTSAERHCAILDRLAQRGVRRSRGAHGGQHVRGAHRG